MITNRFCMSTDNENDTSYKSMTNLCEHKNHGPIQRSHRCGFGRIGNRSSTNGYWNIRAENYCQKLDRANKGLHRKYPALVKRKDLILKPGRTMQNKHKKR